MEFITLKQPETIEPTDNPLANVELLNKHRLPNGEYPSWVEEDVLENIMTAIAETNATALVAVVDQQRDEYSGQYMAFGNTTIGHAVIGEQAVRVVDGESMNQKIRAGIELADEQKHHDPNILNKLSSGHTSLFISPSPGFSEMDPVIASDRYGYDGRTMIRLQTTSPDQSTKYMYSASVFELPLEAVHKFYESRGINTEGSTPALSIMQASFDDELYEGSPPVVLSKVLNELASYCDQPTALKLLEQVDRFTTDQDKLEDTVAAYAGEELAFSKELAASKEGSVRPSVSHFIDQHIDQLSDNLKAKLDTLRTEEGFVYSDELAKIALGVKQEIVKNRASLAIADDRVMKKFEARLGVIEARSLAEQERLIAEMYANGQDTGAADFIRSQTERAVAGANVGCEGGCPAALRNQFGSEAAVARGEAGMEGKLFHAKAEQYSCPKCPPMPKLLKRGVLFDGHGRKYCLDCKSFDGKGAGKSKDNTKKSRQKALKISQNRRQNRQNNVGYDREEQRPPKHWLQYAE